MNYAHAIRFVVCLATVTGFARVVETGVFEKPAAPFTFIMIDAKSENALGEFPFDRSVVAKAVDKAAEMKARGVVLRFFLDRPRSEEGDRELSQSMAKVPVALQACIPADAGKQEAAQPNPLPHRFELMRFGQSQPAAIGGKNGWVPLPDFAERAAAIGFVDSTDDPQKIPLIEAYRDAYVKSLHLVCLEMAFNDGALITPGRDVNINDKSLELDDQSLASIEYPRADTIETFSFIDFLNGKLPEAAIKDKVLIVGVDTARMPTVDTPVGRISAHRAANLQLLALYAHFTN